MPCAGNADTHCCWIAGEECPYVEENTVPGRRWACGLMRVYGSDWDLVLASPEYQEVDEKLKPYGYTCKGWPDDYPGARCGDCGYGCD